VSRTLSKPRNWCSRPRGEETIAGTAAKIPGSSKNEQERWSAHCCGTHKAATLFNLIVLKPYGDSETGQSWAWSMRFNLIFHFRKHKNGSWYMSGLANQSKTKSHISHRVTAKTHIIHMGTHEYQSPHFFLTRTHTFASYICCNYHTPTWQWQNFTRHLLSCKLFSGTSGNYVRAAGNRAKSRMRLASRGLATPDICLQISISFFWGKD